MDGPDGNRIDCMFFPCTAKEEVKVYTNPSADRASVAINDSVLIPNSDGAESQSKDEENVVVPKYLFKPTVIMCNPNALFYQ